MQARIKTALLLEAHRQEGGLGRGIDIFLVLLIVANVVAVVLESVDSIRNHYFQFFIAFEIFSVAIFTIEYLLRLWSCVEETDPENPAQHRSRIRWILSPLGLVDLLAILPFYVLLFIPGVDQSLLMLRIFRGVRLLRLFKLSRYSPALNMLFTVIKNEAKVLSVAASVLIVMLLVASWGMYLLEKGTQPDEFGSIPASMWWAVISLTTVGYGDVVPVTNGGKLFGGIIALIGIGMMALPAAILASGFYREVGNRSDTYRRAVDMALANDRISRNEADELEVLREDLGITSEDAMHTLIQARRDHFKNLQCPHCGKQIS